MVGKNTSLWTGSGVAAYYGKSIVMYVLCAVKDETELSLILHCTQHTYTSLWTCHSTLRHHCMYITTYFYRTFLKIVTLARPKYELPDGGHRPNHVGAF